jgi:hypothetical protein
VSSTGTGRLPSCASPPSSEGGLAAYPAENLRVVGAFLRAGIDVCSTAMTPWVWPAMAQNPPDWIAPITDACEVGGASWFTGPAPVRR